MNSTMLDLFIIAMSVAVLIQLVILMILLVSLRKSSKRMEELAEQVSRHAVPALEAAGAILTESGPRIKAIAQNLESTTASARSGMERVEATVNDALDRVRLQVIRADEITTRALDRVEETAETVQGSISAPARQLSGVMHGVAAGVGAYLRGNSNRRRNPGQDEEMFI